MSGSAYGIHAFWKIPRKPDYVIGVAGDPYMRRWWVIPRNRFFNIYLHNIVRSDDPRALHDHPWWNLSILLKGKYLEHTPAGSYVRTRGAMVLRKATAAHRIELIGDSTWSLFLTGPVIRKWGFICPQGWRYWKEFAKPTADGNMVGKGCD